MAPDKKTKTQPSEGRRTTRSNSGSRLASTAVRDKSSSPSRGRSPKPSPPSKRQASRSRSRSQGRVGRPKESGKSPGRKSSPGKVGRPKGSTKSPGRKPSPAKKSPKRKPSPVKKSPARSGARASSSDRGPVKSAAPKSPAKRADTPRAQSKSPSRPSMAGGRRSVSPAAKQHETNRKGAATPPRLPVGTPGQTVTPRSPLRRRSVPTPWAGAERPEPKGNSVLAEPRIQLDKSQVLYTPDRGRGALRTSARIATMQTTGADDRPDSGKLPEKGKSEKRFAAWESLKSFGWGPSLASLCWLLSLPLLALAVQLLSGSWALLPLPSVPKSLEAYLRWQLFAGYAGFLLAQALLQALPVGRTVYGFPSKVFKHHVAFKYRLNGWVNLLATAAAFGCLVYYGLSASALQLHSLQLLVTVLVTATVLSVLLYVKGRFASRNHRFPGGNTGNILNDFVVGRELSPRIGEVYDLSALCFRCGLLSWAVLVGFLAWQEFAANKCLGYSFATSATCQLIYICMAFYAEEYYLASVFVTEDALGYVSLVANLALLPLLSSLPARYLHEWRPTMPLYCLASIGAIFVLGQTLLHLSHKRKYSFRRNWPDPSSRGQGLDYLLDKSGNRLLVSGLWGLVRHPNYLGSFLCTLAFALPCGGCIFLSYFSFDVAAESLGPSLVLLVSFRHVGERKARAEWGKYEAPTLVVPREKLTEERKRMRR